MKYINGFTFRLQNSANWDQEQLNETNHGFAGKDTLDSLRTLVETTACDSIVLAMIALQETPQSEEIDYEGMHMPTDGELKTIIAYAKEELGLSVILKPMVNCSNGVWRAHINFFDIEVPCEPKWSKWFASYQQYLLHYAGIAEETGCDMLMIGCELVQTERKEYYWRALVKEIRKIYSGPLTYNTDKYQEAQVNWWDCLDVISSSGYYPQTKWQENLDRIEKVVKKYNMPFFFAECGCMCRVGCEEIPNDWTYQGEPDMEIQASYYRTMFEECGKRDWISGFGCWDWASNYQDQPIENDSYSVYKKPAAEAIRDYYANNHK